MKYLIRISIALIVLLINSTAAGQNNITEIYELSKLREDHFDLGRPLDTIKILQLQKSKNKSINKIANLIRLSVELEYFENGSDKNLVDLITKTDWLQDSLTRNLECIVFDDLFRVCMSSQRYQLFHILNVMFFSHTTEVDLNSLCYETFYTLKSGSSLTFFDNQRFLKNLVIKNLGHYKAEYSLALFDRLKLNIVSIGLANYDTLDNSIFLKTLSAFAQAFADSNTNYENLIFAQELSNWGIIKNFEIHNNAIRKKLFDNYSNPFILNLIYHNLDWPTKTRDIFKKILFRNHYSVGITFIQNIDFFTYDLIQYKIKYDEQFYTLGQFDINSAGANELKFKKPDLTFNDSLLKHYSIPEPNWLSLRLDASIRSTTNNLRLQDDIARRYNKKGSLVDLQPSELTKLKIENYKLIKKYNFSNFIDCTNAYYGMYKLIDYYYANDNQSLYKDNSNDLTYDSIYVTFLRWKSCNYVSAMNFTTEKYLLYNGMQKIKYVLLNVFSSSKRYNEYEFFSGIDDVSDLLNDTIPKELYIVKDKNRYLNFITSASDNEIKRFDSLFLSQFEKIYSRHVQSDSSNQQNTFYFFTKIAKNILLDINKRNRVSEKAFFSYLSATDLMNRYLERSIEDKIVEYHSSDSTHPLYHYSNSYFCVNNSDIKNLRSSKNLYVNTIEKVDSYNNGDMVIDSSMKLISYFTADNYQILATEVNGLIDFDRNAQDLYILYSDQDTTMLKKIISIDSLKKVINLDLTKANNFFSATYFNEIDSKSNRLYNIFFAPIDKYIDSVSRYKIVVPNTMISLPLDYIFSKTKGYLPRFVEYSENTNAYFNNERYSYSPQDSTIVFSEMNYNDVYCNINKATTPELRNGILELAYSKLERESISKYMNVVPFTRDNATKFNFISSLINKNASNIHLITHGAYVTDEYKADMDPTEKFDNKKQGLNNSDLFFPQIPSERQLLLFSSETLQNRPKNNILVSYEIKYIDNLKHLKLVYLSACETGMIDDGENSSGYSGFVRELLDRGVQSVIATRWKIQDKYAADFAELFYKNLDIHKDYFEAFFQTKNHHFKKKLNPFGWTSYVLIH